MPPRSIRQLHRLICRPRYLFSLVFITGFLVMSYKQITQRQLSVYTTAVHPPRPAVENSETVTNTQIPGPRMTRKKCDASAPDAVRCWIGEDILAQDGRFNEMIKERVDSDNTIFLASVDLSFVDMALNMYETSFKKFDMKNFLYICSDADAVVLLKEKGIDCFHYQQDTDNTHVSEYNTKNFILKMRVKMKMITAALMLKYTVVLTDVDIVFFRNPLPDMRITADVSFMSDAVMDNCGFYIARPTAPAVKLHQDTLRMCMTRVIADQDAIASVKKKMGKTLHKVNLDRDKFPCGLVFYENGKRMFAMDNPCRNDSCRANVVHNNWIVGKEAKIYRFKETGTWLHETSGYYSDDKRRYLIYQNGVDFGENTLREEQRALATALTVGRVINRTVILPMFTCKGCRYKPCHIHPDHCALNTHFHVKTFDKYFSNLYREHVFLSHPKVPASIKASMSPLVAIKNDKVATAVAKEAVAFTPKNLTSGPTVAELREWFVNGPLAAYSVLNVQSFYFGVSDIESDLNWVEALKKGIRKSTYRQYH